MPDNAKTWDLIHAERKALAETLDGLTPSQWATPSLCDGWTVQLAAAHVVVGAEQSGPRFFRGMAANGFRFNRMVDRDARRLGARDPAQIIERLRARTTTTNHPPAPIMAMLGEVVVHGDDIRRPLGLPSAGSDQAVVACLEMFATVNFPVGGKKRTEGLRLVATDLDWSHGAGAQVSGPARSLLLAMTGRHAGLDGLEGDGAALLRTRVLTPAG